MSSIWLLKTAETVRFRYFILEGIKFNHDRTSDRFCMKSSRIDTRSLKKKQSVFITKDFT